jgi:hypothetical protein
MDSNPRSPGHGELCCRASYRSFAAKGRRRRSRHCGSARFLRLGKPFHRAGGVHGFGGLRFVALVGGFCQGTSRALSEEVGFDRAKVTSTDWLSYPILDITEAPETVDIVLINRPELPPAPAKARSAQSPQRSPTPSLMPPACAYTARR